MKKLLLGILLLSFWTFSAAKEIVINKAKGIDQNVIVSLIPSPANMDVDKDVILTARFDVELDAKHVQKNNVKLKYITQTKESMIDGELAYIENEHAITFTPSKLLEEGYYEVEFKSLKSTKANKDQQIKEIKYLFYVPEIINGHKLPPEPDPTVNNSTLLGIDSNGNGVRDDVERWIYITYKDKHPIHVDIAMQAGRAKQKMLKDPSKAKEIHDEMSAPLYCEAYYQIYAKYFNEPLLISQDVVTRHFRSIIFNTMERKKAYLEYDKLLSGDTYVTPKIGEGKNLCDFNTDKYEE